MRNLLIAYLLIVVAFSSYQCTSDVKETAEVPFLWENANIYFLLTDRFNNGDAENDLNFDRTSETKETRKFMGGDIKGIIQKLEDNYFTDLGITAIWLSPIAEQVHGFVDEGQGDTYAYHGYWAKDWTAMEPNFGTEEDFLRLVETAHAKGIRILLDIVINQTGPVTDKDPVWPDNWVRTEPRCTYQDYRSAVTCTLVENLPDLKTESDEEVDVPQVLKDKWEKEGRLEKELTELDEFFERTGYPRAPRYYMIKWITDYIRKYGIDGFRVDTVKHVEETVWGELIAEAKKVYEQWKKENPNKYIDDREFYILGELYGYNIQSKLYYHYSDTSINYFKYGYDNMINFSFKGDVYKPYEQLFTEYSSYLQDSLDGKWATNYLCSHDDSWSYDKERKDAFNAGTRLLLTPGTSQIYYGDETARILEVEGEEGDANLRSFMNWDELTANIERNGVTINEVLTHYQKLGQFRKAHPAVGAGAHTMISGEPYVFKREYRSENYHDAVVIGLDLPKGEKELGVANVFKNGTVVKDAYSGTTATVSEGKVNISTEYDIVLLEK
jgi:alpha-amylase